METVRLQLNEWEKFRDLRLRGLKEEPQAFGASYEENLKYTEEEWKRRLQNALEEKTNWLIFAKDGDKLVGLIGAFVNKEKSQDTATIYSVYVPREERGKGIAKKLMEELLERILKNKDIKKLELDVNKDQVAAVGLYEKFGFKIVGNQKYTMGNGQEVDEYLMERLV